MNVIVNGEPKETSSGATVGDLLVLLGVKAERIAVELNHSIVKRAQWSTTILSEEDRIEIVHFVGGGGV